ncbi:MAG: squalene/phytoene synthase family protein, partial [Pseudomonadota bacterium]
MLQRVDDGMDAETAALVRRLAPAPTEGGDPAAEAAAITRAAGSSFGPGMRALPAARRRGMWALYAFSRVIDDIADEPMPLTERRRLLTAWRAEIDMLYKGQPVSAIGRALQPAVTAFALPKAEFLMLIDGMERDAEGPIVAPSLAELRAYSRRVAGAVGLLSMRIFGAWREGLSERFAL